jgi:hypothetical protein
MRKLYIAWQDPLKRQWYPVGRLTFENDAYKFVYTKGALKAEQSLRFIPFGRMNKFNVSYVSEELFPLFANRLLSEKRPEYKDYIKWLKLENNYHDNKQLAMLAITGGIRETDSLEILPCPLPTSEGKYEVLFFSHGISHLDKSTVKRVDNLQAGDKLFIMLDVQNSFDPLAISLRTDDPVVIVGYCPRYLTDDFQNILKECGPNIPEVLVDQVNLDAPLQLRLLCKFISPWPKSFQPCSDEEFEPLVRD